MIFISSVPLMVLCPPDSPQLHQAGHTPPPHTHIQVISVQKKQQREVFYSESAAPVSAEGFFGSRKLKE